MDRRARTTIAIALIAASTAGAAHARGVIPPTAPAPVPTTTWASALAEAIPVSGWQNQTLRMVVKASLGGSAVRIRLGDPFSSQPVVIGAASIAQQLNQGEADGIPASVTFGGSTSVTIEPGQSVESDEAGLKVNPGTRLLVSLYLAGGQNITSAPVHNLALETEYNYIGQDVTGKADPTPSNGFGFTAYLEAVEVASPTKATVVAVGDSITDGQGTSSDADTRWTDYLAARAPNVGIANAGIVADEVTADQTNLPSVQTRWQSDVLGQVGVRTVIDAGGINDLRNGVALATLEAAQASLVASAHADGLKIYLTTLTPCSGAALCTSAFESERQQYNLWVRTGGAGADGYADFDAAVGNGAALASQYDSGDHIHPNAAGYMSLANCIKAWLL